MKKKIILLVALFLPCFAFAKIDVLGDRTETVKYYKTITYQLPYQYENDNIKDYTIEISEEEYNTYNPAFTFGKLDVLKNYNTYNTYFHILELHELVSRSYL